MISGGEIAAFRDGARAHVMADHTGVPSGTLDCCLVAGMAAAAEYRHGNLLALLEQKRPPCPLTYQFGGSTYRCLDREGHPPDCTVARVVRKD